MNPSIHVLLATPDPNDVVSMYRCTGPFYALSRTHGIRLTLNPVIDYQRVTQFDVAFFQRPFTADHTKAIEICKRAGVKVWLDYDDLLFDIPTSNPCYSTYAKPAVKKELMKVLSLADLITVSTTQLKKTLSAFTQVPIEVIPNAYSQQIYGRRRAREKEESLDLVNWRGSPTHDLDLFEYAEEIVKASNENPKTKFQFIGYLPWMLEHTLEGKMIYVESLAPDTYFDFINKLQARVQIVPLYDSLFNRCKSNIAWMEGVYGHSLVVAPDWPEWRKPGVITYRDREGFQRALHQAITMPEAERQAVVDSAWEYIEQNLMLTQINDHRYDLLTSLINEVDLKDYAHKKSYDIEFQPDDDLTPELLKKMKTPNTREIQT